MLTHHHKPGENSPTISKPFVAKLAVFATAVSLVVFLTIEFAALAALSVWSISGLMHFGPWVAGVLYAVAGLGSIYVLYKTAVLSLTMEENDF